METLTSHRTPPGTGHESSKHGDMETLSRANQQTRPIQTKCARSFQSHKRVVTASAAGNTRIQSDNALVLGAEKLKKQISQVSPH